jgi:hypothetical protein
MILYSRALNRGPGADPLPGLPGGAPDGGVRIRSARGPPTVAGAAQAGAGRRQRARPPSAGSAGESNSHRIDGNTVIIGPNGDILAGPVRQKEETLIVEVDLGAVLTGRRHMDPVGHYNRPDVFQLHVDTSPRPAFVETSSGGTADPRESNNGAVG